MFETDLITYYRLHYRLQIMLMISYIIYLIKKLNVFCMCYQKSKHALKDWNSIQISFLVVDVQIAIIQVTSKLVFNFLVVTMNDNVESPTPMPPPTKAVKFKSDVWSYFERVEELEGGKLVQKNKCSICNMLMKGGSSAGTSHLRRHLKIHEESQLCQTGQKQLGSNSAGILTTFAFNKHVARKEVVDFVVRS